HTHYWPDHSINRCGDYDAFNAIRLFINVPCQKPWHGNGACWTGHFIRTCYWANDIWMDYYILFLENDILHHAAYWYFRNFNRTLSDEKRHHINLSEARYFIYYFIDFWFWWLIIRFY